MIMTSDDREGCRSLVCDSNGIIIAEMVYRCMICAYISDSICDAQKHYQIVHMDNEIQPSTSLKPEPIDFLDEEEDSEEPEATFSEDDLVSDSNDNFQETFQELEDDLTLINKPSQNISGASPSSARGGFVTCAVCHITKFYASVQRRYGQFTCMGCAKFFGRFLIKPRKYCCPNLGNCPLDATPRCKACLLQACIDTYQIDEKRMKIVNLHRPVRKATVNRQSNNTSPSINSSPPSHPISNSNSTNNNSTVNVSANNGSSGLVKQQRTSILGQQLTSSSTSRSRSSNTAVLALLRSTGKKNWGCRKCAGCLVEDCGKCNYCLDKPKFGGANTLKKKCIQRKCLLQEQQKLEQAQNSLRNALK